MKNNIVMGQFIVEKHGKREENACFGDNATLLCPECFSENVIIEDSKIEKYTLKKGIIFQKVCSSRKVRCLKCDCEFRQLGRDVRRVKREDFSSRLDCFFMIFFAFLAVAGLICAVAFSIAGCVLLAIVLLAIISCVVFMVSMVLGSATASK